jgi:hypothetical protein
LLASNLHDDDIALAYNERRAESQQSNNATQPVQMMGGETDSKTIVSEMQCGVLRVVVLNDDLQYFEGLCARAQRTCENWKIEPTKKEQFSLEFVLSHAPNAIQRKHMLFCK